MPKTKGAKKALRQNVRRRALNLSREKKLKDTVKKFKKLTTSEKTEAQAFLKDAYKAIDKMAKVKFIKKGKANRLKSRLAKKLAK